MKRLLCVLMILALLPLTALAVKDDKLPAKEQITLTVGKFKYYQLSFTSTGAWTSTDPKVANAELEANNKKRIRVNAYAEGKATLTYTDTKGKEKAVVEVTVKKDKTAKNPVPELIQSVIDIALNEWKENGEKKLPQDTKNNPYLKWWRAKCGWCGVFVAYCMEQAGVPMDKEGSEKRLKPLKNGDPHSIRVGGVGRYYEAFTNMDRVTKLPRPGYLVIYGKAPKKGTAYNFEHVGLVTDVIPREDGTYQVFTVEGNWGRMVTRFSYLYDPLDVTHHNLSAVPEEERTDPDIANYEPHKDVKNNEFFVYEFCQTWY